jgi:hypothetical protein
MKEKAKQFGERVKETVASAQKQLLSFEEDVQKFVAKVQDKVLSTPMEGAKKLDDLLRALAVRDFVEKVKTIEMFKQGQAVKKELLDRFGLVSVEELKALKAAVEGLKKEVGALSSKLAAEPWKKATAGPVAKELPMKKGKR